MEDPLITGAPGGSSTPALGSERPADAATHADKGASPPASLAAQAKVKLTGALDGRKSAVADAVSKLADTVQRSGEQFEGRQDWIASAIWRGATELGEVADSLRNRDLRDLAGEVHAFARRRPALFMGAAVAAGFAVARLGKIVAGDLSRADLPTMPEGSHARP